MPDVLFELPPGNFGDGAPARRHPVVHDDRQAVLAQSDIRFDAIDAEVLRGGKGPERVFGGLRVVPAVGEKQHGWAQDWTDR